MNRDPSKPRSFARKLLVLLVILVVAAILAEVGVLLGYPLIRGDSFSWADLRRQLGLVEGVADLDVVVLMEAHEQSILHPYLGYVLDPSIARTRPNGVTYHPYNRLGFSGAEPAFSESDEEVTVAVSGGSVALFLPLTNPQGLGALLADDDRFRGKRIRFANVSLPGFKQPQALLTLNYLLALGADIDIWINFDGFNDVVLPVAENLPAHIAPVYPRGWSVLSRYAATAEERRLRSEIYALGRSRNESRRFISDTILARSAFVLVVWEAIDMRYASRISKLNSELVAAINHAVAAPTQVGPLYGSEPLLEDEAFDQAIDIWKNSSLQMHRLCAANGIQYIHFIQPNQYFVGSKTLSEDEKRSAWAPGGYQPFAEKGYPLLVRAAEDLRAQGVPVVDLTRVFADEPKTVYIDTCCHFNRYGNQELVRHIADAILAVPSL
jgi:hypothetical protein